MDGGYYFRPMWRCTISSNLQVNIIAMEFDLNISIKISLEGIKKS